MSKYIFTNNIICNVWPQATKNINSNIFLNICKNKEMYQRKIISDIVVVVQLTIFDWPKASLRGSFIYTAR